MAPVQTEYGRPDPSEIFAKAGGLTKSRDGTPCLVLQVSIRERDLKVLLKLDELEDHSLTGLAGVEVLRWIAQILDERLPSPNRQTE